MDINFYTCIINFLHIDVSIQHHYIQRLHTQFTKQSPPPTMEKIAYKMYKANHLLYVHNKQYKSNSQSKARSRKIGKITYTMYTWIIIRYAPQIIYTTHKAKHNHHKLRKKIQDIKVHKLLHINKKKDTQLTKQSPPTDLTANPVYFFFGVWMCYGGYEFVGGAACTYIRINVYACK